MFKISPIIIIIHHYHLSSLLQLSRLAIHANLQIISSAEQHIEELEIELKKAMEKERKLKGKNQLEMLLINTNTHIKR